MNFIEYFFRTPVNEMPPSRLMLIAINIFVFILIFYYYKDKRFINPKIIAVLNLIQQVLLYYWYIFRVPEIFILKGLPIYHCRIAIITISIMILLNKNNMPVVFLSYVGLVGSVVTMLTLDLDPYSIIHFSHFSYLLGHYMLAFNSLHIMRENKQTVDIRKGIIYMVTLNIFIESVNIFLPKANYAELHRMPNMFPFFISQPWYFMLSCSVYILLMLIGREVHKKFIKRNK